MPRKQPGSPAVDPPGCCRVDALLSIDERGQMVLPKETRARAGIHAGDKLALVSWDLQGEPCCLVLIKADRLTQMVQSLLTPLLGSIRGPR